MTWSDEPDEVSRFAESAETAFFEGHDELVLMLWQPDGSIVRKDFSKRFEADGITFAEPGEQMFNFNNPVGACPVCEGFGNTLDISEQLVIPDPYLSLYDDCVAAWRGPTHACGSRLLLPRRLNTASPSTRLITN